MSYTRNAREQREFERVFHADHQTLRNKLGITNQQALDAAERDANSRRAGQGLPDNARQLTYDGFKAIHRHLFGDIYDWAGRERKYTTGRGAAPFAPPEQIASWMEKQFTALKKERFLAGLPREQFAERAAHYVNEFNAVHPFVDGNGRTQRMWLRLMADHNGFEFRLTSNDREAWNNASRIGFTSSNKPMAELIAARLHDRDKRRSQDAPELQEKAKRAAERIAVSRDAGKDQERER